MNRRRRRFNGRPTRYDRKQDQRIKLLERQVETKEFKITVALAATAADSAWNILLLNSLAIGDTGTTRDGGVISMKSLAMRLKFEPSGAVVSAFQALHRIAIVLFTGDPGTVTDSSVFADDDITGLLIRQQRTPASQIWSNYKVLYDKTFKADLREQTMYHKIYIDLHGALANWGDATGSVQPLTGTLALFFCMDGRQDVIFDLNGHSRLLFEE